MKCTVCKNGKCKKAFVSVMFDKNRSIVIFKNVSAMVCDNCGARFFDGETSSVLLRQAREARKNGSELEILNLKAA